MAHGLDLEPMTYLVIKCLFFETDKVLFYYYNKYILLKLLYSFFSCSIWRYGNTC